MKRPSKMKLVALAVGLSCLVAGIAAAQQATQYAPGQSERTAKQPRAGETSRSVAGGQSQEVDRYLASCWLAKNQGEIEISQVAEQRSNDRQVKQFAQMMINEHRELSPKLQQIAGTQGSSASGQYQNQIGQPGQPGQSGQPGQPNPQPFGASNQGETGQYDAGQQAGETPRPPRPSGNSAPQAMENESGAIGQLIAIDRQISDRISQTMQQKLEEKSGAAFDQCYLGGQVACHLQASAALEVIAQQASGPLKQIASEAHGAVQEHLQKAEQLLEQREGGRQASARGDRDVRPASAEQ